MDSSERTAPGAGPVDGQAAPLEAAAPAPGAPAAAGPGRPAADDDGPVIELSGVVDAPEVERAAPESDGPVIELSGLVDVTEEPAAAPVPVARRPAEAPWSPSNVFMALTAFLVAAADLASKEWAKINLAGPDLKRTAKHVVVIPDHLDLIFAQNPGGAWSFLRTVPDGLRRPFFLFVSAAAIVFIVRVYQRLERRQWAMRWGLPLALGGALGNLADRVRYGWVVDFIDMFTRGKDGEMHWPTFNVADVAIVIGVGLMALDLLSLRRPKQPQGGAPEAAGGAA